MIGHLTARRRLITAPRHTPPTSEQRRALDLLDSPEALRHELDAVRLTASRQRQYIAALERHISQLTADYIPRGCVDAIARAGSVCRRYAREGESA